MKENLSLNELVKSGIEMLEANGVENAKGDVVELINLVKPISQSDILINGEMSFSKDEVKSFLK